MSAAKTDNVGIVQKIGKLYRGVVNEMKKVYWPGKKDLTAYTIVVLVSVFILGLTIWVIDSAVSLVMGFIIR